jgi:glucan phosphorylase
MAEEDYKLDDSITDRDLLFRIARELQTLRQQANKALFAMGEAEKEVPEYMRRFANYFHDIVHIKGEYVTLGIQCPRWLDEEMERLHDRMRQALHDLHTDGGAFEQVRRKMAEHPVGNRYDHTRQLAKPNGESK